MRENSCKPRPLCQDTALLVSLSMEGGVCWTREGKKPTQSLVRRDALRNWDVLMCGVPPWRHGHQPLDRLTSFRLSWSRTARLRVYTFPPAVICQKLCNTTAKPHSIYSTCVARSIQHPLIIIIDTQSGSWKTAPFYSQETWIISVSAQGLILSQPGVSQTSICVFGQ